LKNSINILLCAFLLLATVPQQADAAIGLIWKKKTVKIIGAATTGTGVVSLFVAKAVAESSTAFLAGLGWGLLGVALGAVGIILLDDNIVQYQFPVLSQTESDRLGISYEDREIYNGEVNRLNQIKQFLENMDTKDTTIEQTRVQWESNCADHLSLETCAVKAIIAEDVLAHIKF